MLCRKTNRHYALTDFFRIFSFDKKSNTPKYYHYYYYYHRYRSKDVWLSESKINYEQKNLPHERTSTYIVNLYQ